MCICGKNCRTKMDLIAYPPKDRGVALVIAILIGFVILAFLSVWINIIITSKHLVTLEQDRIQAFYTAESGLTKALWYLKGNGGKNSLWRTQDADLEEELFTKKKGNCKIAVKDNGAFLEISSTGKTGKASKTVSALFGEEPSSEFLPALILNSNKELIIEPSSEIRGDLKAALPPANRGGIFSGRFLSLDKFPSFSSVLYDNAILKYRDIVANPHRADLELFSPQTFDEEHKPDFKGNGIVYVNDAVLFQGGAEEEPLIFNGPGTIVSTADIQLSNYVKLIGIALISAGKITLFDHSAMKDGILFSEVEVALRDDSRFSGQVFSIQDITMADRARIEFPSLLYSSGVLTSGKAKGTISVSDEAVVNGTIISHSQSGLGSGNEITVEIGEDAVVNGIIYAQNRATIYGRINGCVAAQTLYIKSSPSDTLNTNRLNGIIDRTALPYEFVLSLGFSQTPKYKMISFYTDGHR